MRTTRWDDVPITFEPVTSSHGFDQPAAPPLDLDESRVAELDAWLRVWKFSPGQKKTAWLALPRAEREETYKLTAKEFAVFMGRLALTPEILAAQADRMADRARFVAELFPPRAPLMGPEVAAFDRALQRMIDEINEAVPLPTQTIGP